FAALDYRAHGESLGDFREFTIGGALEDTLAVMDIIGDTPLILVGSSMGGWIALLAAMERKERVCGLVGIAAAPDFTERLIWSALSDDKRKRMEEEGELSAPSEYGLGEVVYTHALITEGRSHLLLEDAIALSIPVRLLQGMQDEDVPWMTAMDIQRTLASDDVQITLIKDGDHRLSRACDLTLLCSTVANLVTMLSEEGRIAA
ncbi:MAG: alpha/beta hydrolase, partial [Alphaproteobacteria bacterium]|nr:alpha/beta hydrolase [Alphaproteobacteria bacterium]